MTNTKLLTAAILLSLSTIAQAETAPALTDTTPVAQARLGAYADIDVGVLAFLKQGASFGGGVSYGPFRAGASYTTFLSNASLGGVPDGFDLRVNYLLGANVAYFIGQKTDKGLYVQGMLHIKQQGERSLRGHGGRSAAVHTRWSSPWAGVK